MAYRIATSGFFGSLLPVLSRVDPKSVSVVGLVLPTLNQGLDAGVHWWRGTPKLGLSLLIATVITVWASFFNCFAMREGTFVVSHGGPGFAKDLRDLPGFALALTFGWLRCGP